MLVLIALVIVLYVVVAAVVTLTVGRGAAVADRRQSRENSERERLRSLAASEILAPR